MALVPAPPAVVVTAQCPISLGPQHLRGHRAAPSSHTSARPRNVRWGDSPGGRTQEHPPRAPPQGSAHTGPPAQGPRCLGFPLPAEWTWPPLPHTPCPEPCDRPHKQGRQSGAGHKGSQGQPTGSLSGGAGGADERGSPTDLSSLLALPSPCPLESVGTHSQGRTLGTCTTLAWAAEAHQQETRRFFCPRQVAHRSSCRKGPSSSPRTFWGSMAVPECGPGASRLQPRREPRAMAMPPWGCRSFRHLTLAGLIRRTDEPRSWLGTWESSQGQTWPHAT